MACAMRTKHRVRTPQHTLPVLRNSAAWLTEIVEWQSKNSANSAALRE